MEDLIQEIIRNAKKIDDAGNKSKIEFVSTPILWKLKKYDRRKSGLNKEKFLKLKNSILKDGIKDALLITYANGKAILEKGNHRVLIGMQEKIKKLPAIVKVVSEKKLNKGVKVKGLKKEINVGEFIKPSNIGVGK